MNTKAKGTLWEKIAARTMEVTFNLRVYTTERKMLRQAWGGFISLSNDIYGGIDHIGKRKGWGKTMWVQTTCGSGIGVKAREINALEIWGPNDIVEIWRGVGGKKGKVIDRRFTERTEVDRWYFQRYRMENNFKMVKGDVIVIPPEVLAYVRQKPKAPACPICGGPMKKELERQVGKCGECIRKGVS